MLKSTPPPSIKFILDRGENARFTNADIISGKLQVTIKKGISVSAIQIKLKGSQSTLIEDVPSNQSRRAENHELLYDCEIVFPPDNIREVTKNKHGFKLIAGVYEYPFCFNLPVNGYCGDPDSIKKYSKFYNSTEEEMMMAQAFGRVEKYEKLKKEDELDEKTKEKLLKYHKVAPLPPPCSGDTGANKFDISYSLKATIRRSSSFRSSIRKEIKLDFVVTESDEAIEQFNKKEEEEATDANSDTVSFDKILSKELLSEDQIDLAFKMLKNYDSMHYKLNFTFSAELKLATRLIRNNEIPEIEKFSFLTEVDPQLLFQYEDGESNGTGIIYIKEFHISLVRHSTFRALDMEDETQKTYKVVDYEFEDDDIKVDLADAIPSLEHEDVYELEFPRSLVSNLRLPEKETLLLPSFETCCVHTWYTYELMMRVAIREGNVSPKTEVIKIQSDVLVLSGIRTAFELDSEGINGRVPIYDINEKKDLNEIDALPRYTKD